MSYYSNKNYITLQERFRGFLPIVVDVETSGFNPKYNALLEIACVALKLSNNNLIIDNSWHYHIKPFTGAHLDPDALKFNKIHDPYHPFRFAIEEKMALKLCYAEINKLIAYHKCSRAILVGHNPCFDLSFITAANKRCKLKSPFHKFTTFDTATLSGAAYGQTVLAKAAKAADLKFDTNQAHSAIYDAKKTAELFCTIINSWNKYNTF